MSVAPESQPQTQDTHAEPQPKFSSFALMILILLAIFALMSRADRIFQKCGPLLKDFVQAHLGEEAQAPGIAAPEGEKRVISVIGESQGARLPAARQEPPARSAARPASARTVGERNITATPGGADTATATPVCQPPLGEVIRPEGNDAEAPLPQYPIVPAKPERGDKLGYDERLALANRLIPAESLAARPAERPQEAARTYLEKEATSAVPAATPAVVAAPEAIAAPVAAPEGAATAAAPAIAAPRPVSTGTNRNAAPGLSRSAAADNSRAAKPAYYVLGRQETLWSVSVKFYGDGKLWPEIVKANPGMNADKVMAGQKIILPKIENGRAMLAAAPGS